MGVPGRKTKEIVTAADAIIDALDTAEEEVKRLKEHKVVQTHMDIPLLPFSNVLLMMSHLMEHLLNSAVCFPIVRKNKRVGRELNFNLML